MKACGCLTAVSYSFEPDWPFASLSSSFVRYHLCCKGFSTNHCRWCVVCLLFCWILSGHVQGNICKSMVSNWTYFDLWPNRAFSSTQHSLDFCTYCTHSSQSTINYHVHYIQSLLLPHSDAHFELQQLIFTMSHMPNADSLAIVLKSNQPLGRKRWFVGTLLPFFMSHPKEILLNLLLYLFLFLCQYFLFYFELSDFFEFPLVWLLSSPRLFPPVLRYLVRSYSLHFPSSCPLCQNEGWYQLHLKFVLQDREIILFLCFLLLILSLFYCPQYFSFPPCKWFFVIFLVKPFSTVRVTIICNLFLKWFQVQSQSWQSVLMCLFREQCKGNKGNSVKQNTSVELSNSPVEQVQSSWACFAKAQLRCLFRLRASNINSASASHLPCVYIIRRACIVWLKRLSGRHNT